MIDRDRFPVDPWRLVETGYTPDDAGVSETLFAVANGHLGLRGNLPEGRHASEHGTFLNGLHEVWPIKHAEQAYGFAEVGQTIVNAPDAKVIRVSIDDDPLSLDLADLREYERSIDFRDGVLRRTLLWVTPAGKHVRIEDERFVSFESKPLAVMRLRVTVLNADATVVISSQLINRQDGEDVYGGTSVRSQLEEGDGPGFDPRKAEHVNGRVLVPQEYWQRGMRSALSYRVAESRMTLGIVVDHELRTENEAGSSGVVEPDFAKTVFTVRAKAGVPTEVAKFAAYHISRGVPARELVERAALTVDRAQLEGVEHLVEQQRAWLEGFWERSDVRIPDHDALQQAIRWCLFQLAQASARSDAHGIPAKGMTGSGYGGHYFWDTEIYVLPFLTYTSPQWAHNALRMRVLMLDAARKRARMLNETGALFPWRTINGEEASAYYAAGTAQYHINADVSFALSKYVHATGDTDFLHREGVDVLVETARLWVSLGFVRRTEGQETFNIHGVTGPDEYTAVVNDNLFTNVMARFNLRAAVEAVREMALHSPEAYRSMVRRLSLVTSEVEDWEHAADSMFIPYSEALGIHPQDAMFLEREVWDLENTPEEQRPLLLHFHPLVIYRFQVLKQADIVLALFLQGDQFSAAEKLADFDYYDPLTTGDSTLSAVVQSILAAEVGYRDLALEYFEKAVHVDLGDLHHNAAHGVHVASAGGVWSALVFGFGGMRDHGGRLTFDPRLPVAWPALTFPIEWQGARIEVTVTRDEFRARLLEGGPVSFQVRGADVTVTVEEEVVVPLDGQGPVLSGRPSQRQFVDARRDDGTLLESSVPVITASVPIIQRPAAVDQEGMELPFL